MKIFRSDTETKPIRAGRLAPGLICGQYALDQDGAQAQNGPIQVVLRETYLDALEAALKDPDCLIEFFNGAFDQAVTCAARPSLTPLWFAALAAGRGRDCYLREQLCHIRAGRLQDNYPKGYWSLAGVVKRRCGIELDKGEATWRLRYALLEGVPVCDWPIDALKYAYDDVEYLRRVSRLQNAEWQSPDEWLQVAAAFVLQLAAVWGLRVDEDRLAAAQLRFMQSEVECRKVLDAAGFFNGDSLNKKALQAAVELACKDAGLDIPRTAPSKKFEFGQTKTDAETCEMLADFSPSNPEDEALAKAFSGLTRLAEHNTNGKMLATYLEPMQHGTKYAMTSRPNALVGTGRTSWAGSKLRETNPWWPAGVESKVEVKAGTNLQNWPQMEGIRDCIKPREGFYFASVDYNSLELRTLAQCCIWLVGESTFAKGYQADRLWDPHSYFGGKLVGLDYEAALARKKSDPSFKKGPRAVGKASNFALPGGVGGKKLAWMFAKLFKSGELLKRYSVEECYAIKEAWFHAYPEMRPYFEYIAWLQETGTPLKQFVSNRVRGGVTYSSGANSFFQGLAADLAKRALFYVSQACYVESDSPLFGSRVVAFIHDEILAEVPIDKSHEAAFEIERLMLKGYAEVVPDCPGAAEPALMAKGWSKLAEPKFNAAGRLIPFDL